ncbi:DUF5009 domain-containing protein [Allomuricauda sp. SCSIO 65647]|uniref:DUF5009 domain-containing protein n=1 Tax=Allomuricauda sp. SCSIO 65647 TaxID=2908843 RepID=UPI001F39BBAB|nr:DUF5009 domain-containing protein [Muricauda sp. SCSIO 65647]UJH67178.1 DUF5009 domain-containing protein [Muricauda sp. SCSIO 65647]
MRIASIDILRALTMLLMIWVNDFWTLTNVPKWLEHAKTGEDYLGFSDIIFPLFLFIVGLSIPHAINSRLKKGHSKTAIAWHILVRSFSLLLIGVFMVNYEMAHDPSIPLGKYGWCFFMALGVCLIWMDWKRSPLPPKWHRPLQAVGVLILLILALVYKGGPQGEQRMQTSWWGILGLIGWAYLANALLFLVTKGRWVWVVVIWLLFNILSVIASSDTPLWLPSVWHYFSVLFSGTIPAFTAAGVMATVLFSHLAKKKVSWGLLALAFFGLLNLLFGFMTRPEWGISKLGATPSWLAICSAIGFFTFALLYYIADIKKITRWALPIRAAGTATLTCYLIPYFVYPIRQISNIRLPNFLNDGMLGLLVSFLFALAVVWLTGWFEKKGFKLKL